MQAPPPISTATHPSLAARPPADPLDILEQFGTPISIAESAEIHVEGDPALFCYRVISGLVRTVRLLEDGRRQVSEFLLPGDLLGFDALDTHDVSAQAVGSVLLRRFPRRTVDALTDGNAALARRLREITATTLRKARDQILSLGRKTASERIASFLLTMHTRTTPNPTGHITLPSRADMADHLGLTLETVSRTLNHLHRTQIIHLARALVSITNPTTLTRLASGPRR